jgi:hypothetical protein
MRRLGKILAGTTVALLVGLAGLAIGLQAARTRALETFERTTGELGLRASIGDVRLAWTGAVELRDVALRWGGGAGEAHAELWLPRVDASFSVPALLKGSKWPTSLGVKGGTLTVRAASVAEAQEMALELAARWRQRRRNTSDTTEGSRRELPEVNVKGFALDLQIDAQRATVELHTASVAPAPERKIRLSAAGSIDRDGFPAAFTASALVPLVREQHWEVDLDLERPTSVWLPLPLGHALVELQGVSVRTEKSASLRGLRVEVPARNLLLRADAITVFTEPWTARSEPPAVQRFEGAGVRVDLGSEHADVEWGAVTLSPAWVPTSAWQTGLPRVREVSARKVAAAAEARGMWFDVQELTLEASGIDLAHPRLGVERLRATAPRARWLTTLSRPAEADAVAPDPGADADLPDLAPEPKATASKTVRAPSPPPGESAELAALEAKLSKLVARVAGLDAKITGGAVELEDAGSREKWILTGLDVAVGPRKEAPGVRAELSAHLSESSAREAALEFSVEVEPSGRIDTVRLGSSGPRLARFLPQISPHLRSAPGAELSLDVLVRREGQTRYVGAASLTMKGVGFEWWRVANRPVDGLDLEVGVDGTYDASADRFTGKVPRFRVGQVQMTAELDVQRVTGTPVIDLDLRLPTTSCDAVVASIPPALIPRLQGIRAKGEVNFDLSLDVDLLAPDGLELALEGNMDTCHAYDLGPDIQLSILSDRKFVHRPVVKGEVLDVAVGPGTRWWTKLSEIPSWVAMGAVATEDLDFFEHRGFKLSLIRRAMKMDLERKRYVYGGSTISQQLVKNLFLTREKTLARKLEEAIITWEMEHTVSKDRILELYLNCIEYGPEIYGIRMAARHYFGKEPRDLTPLEGAFLMGNKPCPSCGYRQWKRGGLDARWQHRMQHIMKRLRDRGWITPEQFEAEAHFKPVFTSAAGGP